jgi:teichuronic acid biosynthesis glycosyltransferase TuaH
MSKNGHLENRDIILFSLKPWDTGIGSSSKKYARVFAQRNNRVLFVNRALDRMSVIKFRNDPKTANRLQSLKNREKALVEVEKNIWTLDPLTILESINKIPFPGLFDWLNKINNRRLAKQINLAATKLGFSDIILYIENDFIRAQYLQDLIKNLDISIYYIRDYLPSQNYFKMHGKRLEPQLIGKSDVVITNSVYLEKYAKQFNPKSYFVGQGCDTTLFSGLPQKEPEDITGIPRPIIGYAGALLSTRLDINLIREIAMSNRNKSIVLVGPEDEDFKRSDLHGQGNIFFLGHKRIEDLPKYVAHFDLCINPQVVNEMTVGNYPLKIDEYLAMGKTVVATRTEAMEMFSDYVKLANTTQEYLDLITQAFSEKLTAGEIDRRIAFAKSHTWENCVLRLDEVLYKN